MSATSLHRSELPDSSVDDSRTDTPNLKELGAFIRAHREHTRPGDVGIAIVDRRRTPGLRREEVSALSGVGLAWYSWIEQGRVAASKQVLEAIARTLELDAPARRHLLALAGYRQPSVSSLSSVSGGDGLAARALGVVLDGLGTSPAILLNPLFDIAAWNDAYRAVWFDPAEIEPRRRNLMWALVGRPELRERVADWESLALAILASFRAHTALRADAPRTRELYEALMTDFPEFEGWWTCQGVDDLVARPIELHAPGGRRLSLLQTALHPIDDPAAILLVQSPVDAESQQALEALAAREGDGRPAPVAC